MLSILIRKPKSCSSWKSSSTNWNESKMPVSRRSVSGDGTSMWKLSTNRAPRRSMMAFASVTLLLLLAPPLRRARPAIGRPGAIGCRCFRLRRAEFGAEERILQSGTVDLAVVILGQDLVAHPAGREIGRASCRERVGVGVGGGGVW